MKLTLLPLQNDDVIRVRCDGPVSRREPGDPLQALLGPHCYGHRVLMSLERCQAVDTGGITWLVKAHKRFQESGGKLVLFGVPPVVIDVLNFLRITSMLNIAPGEHAACEMVLLPTDEKAPEGQPVESAIRFPR